MKIITAQFTLGVANTDQLPDDSRKEVAFLGRSNVGKSSLLNRLCNRKVLARRSADPGKTRELNFYLVNDQFYFVDMPGYGYAKVSKDVRDGWGRLIEQYLTSREQLVLAVQLVDVRMPPTPLDIMTMEWLEYNRVPFAIALTKSDKVSRAKGSAQLNELKHQCAAMSRCHDIVLFSAVTGEGKASLLDLIRQSMVN